MKYFFEICNFYLSKGCILVNLMTKFCPEKSILPTPGPATQVPFECLVPLKSEYGYLGIACDLLHPDFAACM